MPIKASQLIAGLVVLIAVVMAATTINPLAVCILLAALGIAIIIPW